MHIDRDAVLDFTKTKKAMIYQHNVSKNRESITTIGRVYFKELLAVKGVNVNLIGDIKVPTSESATESINTMFVVEAEHLKVFDKVTIRSGFQMLHANETIELRPGAKVESTRKYMCNIHNNAPDLYTCMDNHGKWGDKIQYDTLIDRFNEQFPGSQKNHKNIMLMEYMWEGLKSNYTTYIQSLGNLKMDGNLVKGPRIGICASNVQMHESTLDTDGHGCPSDFGFGKGQKYGSCGGSGGANGGFGGYGGLEHDKYHDKCTDKHPHAYYNGLMANYEGSGGSSADPGKRLGGAGGGIIRMLVLNELRAARSTIKANGGDGQNGEKNGSGGGAGGTIQILSSSLKGESQVYAKGGRGSDGGGGGGAGGRLFINFVKGFTHDA